MLWISQIRTIVTITHRIDLFLIRVACQYIFFYLRLNILFKLQGVIEFISISFDKPSEYTITYVRTLNAIMFPMVIALLRHMPFSQVSIT